MNGKKNYALSSSDIKRALKGKTKIITYDKLKNYNNIDEVLSPYGCAVILYLETPNSGHWVALIKHQDRIEHFDSYGVRPDEEFLYIDNKKINYSSKRPTLSELLIFCPYKIEYNEIQFQKDGNNDIATCGRWCIIRCLLKHMTLDYFQEIFKQFKDPDSVVTELTRGL